MSKSGVACYRNGGCGPYEMYSCSECPASKSDYLQVKAMPKPPTNYDRLVRKTPEEIADLFKEWECPFIFGYTGGCKGAGGCRQCWLDWLNMEVVE